MKALIWKELREYRMFLWAMLSLIALIRISHEIIPHFISGSRITYDIWNVYFGIFLLPVLFAFTAAMPFNSEFIQGTRQFLLNRPIATWKIFAIKAVIGMLIMIFLTIISYYVFYMPNIDKGRIIGLDKGLVPDVSIYVLLICSTAVYFSILLSSLLFKNSIVSIMMSPFVMVIDFLLCLPVVVFFLYYGIQPMKCLYVLTPMLMTAILIMFCYVIWKYSVVNESGAVKASLITLVIVLTAFYTLHGAVAFASQLKLNKAFVLAEREGISLSPRDTYPAGENADLDEILRLSDRIDQIYLSKIWDFITSDSKFPYNCKWKDDVDEMKRDEIRILFAENKDILEFFRRCRSFAEAEDGKTFVVDRINMGTIFEVKDLLLLERKDYSGFLDNALCRLKLKNILRNSYNDYIIAPRVCFLTMIAEIPNENKYEEKCRKILEMVSSETLTEREFINGSARFYGEFFRIGKAGKFKYSAEEYGFGSFPERFAFSMYRNYLGSPLLNRDAAFFINFHIEKLKLCSIPFNRLENIDKEDDFIRYKDYCHFIGMFIGGNTVYNYNRFKASEGYYVLALALKAYKLKYGEYPESLEKLCHEFLKKLPIDPFSGEGFTYEKKGNGFDVHSVGRSDGKFKNENIGVSCEQ